ncbi:MAG: hypothetical protein ACR2N6_05920 [Miltoncostaeaceae bacterium]
MADNAPVEVHRFALPEGATGPVEVFVNGSALVEGTDFIVEGVVLRFTPPLRAQPPLGLGRKIMLAIGIGVYGDLRGDSLDVHFRQAGRPQALTDVRLTPTPEG